MTGPRRHKRIRVRVARRSVARAAWLLCLEAAARDHKVQPARAAAIKIRNAATPAARARVDAIYLAVTVFNVPRAWLAPLANCTRSNISRICARCEDRRDNPAVDARLMKLEQELEGRAR